MIGINCQLIVCILAVLREGMGRRNKDIRHFI